MAGACFLTVLLARLLGNSPGILRAVAMGVATFSMMANPSSGYFPPAGALCALYVEKAVATSVSPQYGYALFPCATGVADPVPDHHLRRTSSVAVLFQTVREGVDGAAMKRRSESSKPAKARLEMDPCPSSSKLLIMAICSLVS